MAFTVRDRYYFFFEAFAVRLSDLAVWGNHWLRMFHDWFLNSCSQIMRNGFWERYRGWQFYQLLASGLLLLLTYRIILRCELLFLKIMLLNILFRQLNTTTGDASDGLFRNGNISQFIIDGSCTFLFVFGGDLLLLMRFDKVILVEGQYFLNLVLDWRLLIIGVLIDLTPSRAPKCHYFNSFTAFWGHLLL